jgi:hypothetical protein
VSRITGGLCRKDNKILIIWGGSCKWASYSVRIGNMLYIIN